MEQSPSEANSSQATEEIPPMSRNSNVYFRIHHRPPLVPSWARWIQTNLTALTSILILSSHLGLGSRSDFFTSGFPTKTLYSILFSSTRSTGPAQSILLNLITGIIFGIHITQVVMTQFSTLLVPPLS